MGHLQHVWFWLLLLITPQIQPRVYCMELDASSKDELPLPSSIETLPFRQSRNSQTVQNDCVDDEGTCTESPHTWSNRARMFYGSTKARTQIKDILSNFVPKGAAFDLDLPWNRKDNPYWSNRGRRQDREYRSGGMLEFPLLVDEPQWVMLEHDIRELSDIDLGPFYVTRGRKKWYTIPEITDNDELTPDTKLSVMDSKRSDSNARGIVLKDSDYPQSSLASMFRNIRTSQGDVFKARSHKSAEPDSNVNVPFFGSRGKKAQKGDLKKTYWDTNLGLNTRSSEDQPFFAHRGKRPRNDY